MWLYVLIVLVCMVASAGLGILVPRMTGHIVDVISSGSETEQALMTGILLIVGISLINALLVFLENAIAGRIGQGVIYRLRNDMYSHMVNLPFSFYDKAQTGQLMSRVTSDVETLRMFLSAGFTRLINNIFVFTAVLVMLLSMHWQLTLLSMVTIPLLFWMVMRFGKLIRPQFRVIQEQIAKLNTVLQENITGIRVVKAFGREATEVEKFNEENQAYLDCNIRMTKITALHIPLMNTITALSTAILIWYGGRQIILGSLSIGDLVAFNSLLMMLIMPVRMLGWQWNMLQRSIAAGTRIFEVLDTSFTIKDNPDAMPLKNPQGAIEFDQVWFGYDKEAPVLRGLNLQVEPGQTVALLGGTGSGKTTVINLVPRFYDPDQGVVRFDGTDISKIRLADLRGNIGMVMQETFLFSTTIRDNISFGRADASQKEIEEAAKAAQIHDFIMSLPDGYDTVVGERGLNLSGGQKQRLSIARALLMDPAVLILDDSLSSVDTETEYLIQQAIENLIQGRTTFVVAQRLSTVKNADIIVVLDKGIVVQRGTHTELIAQEGPYQDIYRMQFGSVEEENGRGTGYAHGYA